MEGLYEQLYEYLPCDEGSVSDLSGQLSFVFQDAGLLPWRTVYDNVKAVCPAKNSAKIHSILSDVGLAGSVAISVYVKKRP